MYIPIQNGIDNEITAGDINNTEENCKNFNVNLSTRKTGVAERNKDSFSVLDDNSRTTARRYKGCQSSSVNYERQTHSEDEKDSSLQHVRVPAESDKVAPKIAGSFGKNCESTDKIDEAGRVKEETTGPTLSGEKAGRNNNSNMMTQMSSNRKPQPKKESLYQKKSLVGTARKVKI